MANPVIFDDGGSTRIKLLLQGGGVGAMDGLLDVDLQMAPPQSTVTVNHNYASLTVSAIDAAGAAQAAFNSPLLPNDTFTLTSGNGQKVVILIDAGRRCVITVSGTAGNPPLVEAKQFNKKRRYVISNAGPIQRVNGTANGAAFDVITANNVYTSVYVND